MRVRRVAAVVAVLCGAGLALPAPSPAGSAEAPTAFSASATAGGISAVSEVPNYFIVSTLAEVGAPTAQAVLESNGNRAGFASMPYPGELVVSGPGTFAGLTGMSLPGGYPFFVASNAATPEAVFSDPSGRFTLESRSQPSDVSSIADVAASKTDPVVGRMVTTAQVTSGADGVVTSTAESRMEGLSFGNGALRLAGVTSRSVTRRVPGADRPEVSHSLELQGLAVNGIAVELVDGKLTVASPPVPIPTDSAELEKQLAAAGISLRLVEAEASDDGGQTGYLEIRMTQKIPLPDNPTGYVTFRIGRTSTSIVRGAAADSGGEFLPPIFAEPSETLPPEATFEPTPATAPENESALATPAEPVPVIGSPAVPSSFNEAAAASPGATEPPPLLPPPGAQIRRTVAAVDVSSTFSWLFLVLAAAAAVLVAVSTLTRKKGVQTSWSR